MARVKNEAGTSTNAYVLLRLLPRRFNKSRLYKWLYGKMLNQMNLTADEVVKEYVSDPRLIALLSGGQLIDWNLQPNKASWWVVASMMRYYIDGGFYPRGGSDKIAESIIPVIEASGGRVLCRARVAEILCDDAGNTVRGVQMANGDVILASTVISAAGFSNTFESLLPKDVAEKHKLATSAKELGGVRPSNGHITAFVSLDAPYKTFDLRGANIHSMPELARYNYDISEMQEAFYADPFSQKECLMTLTCPAAKDPEYEERFPEKSNVLLLTEAKWEWLAGHEDEQFGKRSEWYNSWKKKFEPMFLDRLYKYYPKTRGHVEKIEIGTPLTTKHFLGAPTGESYGLEWTPDRFGQKVLDSSEVQTPIRGLYLTGEFTLFGGFAGALVTAFVSVFTVIGPVKFLWTLGTAPRQQIK
eukprot:TRINITY_DN4760_c0_g2_i1.p1 TRINITY_DN4760_c0_g2~~TRINITY_DN4760_c0_g2_i1.p1  ORF type:complete len:464 (-),score=87.12 TRINITY_DN4760_c0_g2_i1:234-1478(-)